MTHYREQMKDVKARLEELVTSHFYRIRKTKTWNSCSAPKNKSYFSTKRLPPWKGSVLSTRSWSTSKRNRTKKCWRTSTNTRSGWTRKLGIWVSSTSSSKKIPSKWLSTLKATINWRLLCLRTCKKTFSPKYLLMTRSTKFCSCTWPRDRRINWKFYNFRTNSLNMPQFRKFSTWGLAR